METKNITVSLQPQGKSLIFAYLLWWFLGWGGVHRFYLGKIKTGVAQLILFLFGWATTVILIGFLLLAVWAIWWLIDVYFVHKYVSGMNTSNGYSSSIITMNSVQKTNNDLEQLERLHNLFEKGAITKEQYESKKSGLI